MSNLASYKVISETLGVSSNQVYMWFHRRSRNGFPEHVACSLVAINGNGPRRSPLFDLQAVIDWWVGYTPDPGGAPAGNMRGLKHGRYIGQKARLQAAKASR